MRQQTGPAELGFDRYDKGRLEKALQKVSDKRTYVRLKAILLIAQGMTIQSVATFFDKSLQVVYHWIRTYVKTHQASSLFDAPRSGRPRAAQGITDKRILGELKRNPLHLGYRTTVW